ncbi:MAG: hypothetical protein KKA79_02970 [Nanoarchaeota archaeon]|nr:hypothetical protein [Nanoarchaeota archaeon]
MKILPVEIKSDLKKPKLTKSFHSFLEKYKPKNGLILSETLYQEKNKIKFRPIFSVAKEIL